MHVVDREHERPSNGEAGDQHVQSVQDRVDIAVQRRAAPDERRRRRAGTHVTACDVGDHGLEQLTSDPERQVTFQLAATCDQRAQGKVLTQRGGKERALAHPAGPETSSTDPRP